MKAEKLRRNFWLTSEIECMLDLIKEVQSVQGTTATTHYTFVHIANKMKKRGYSNKSPTQIRRKWFQMKSAYLCYKRGNIERLLLIPEKFRPVIAEFVEAEYKTDKASASVIVKLVEKKEKQRLVFEEKPSKTDVVKQSYYHRKFAGFLTRMKHTHKVVNKDFKNMQTMLMLYEQKFQSLRDSNMIMFIKNNKYKY